MWSQITARLTNVSGCGCLDDTTVTLNNTPGTQHWTANAPILTCTPGASIPLDFYCGGDGLTASQFGLSVGGQVYSPDSVNLYCVDVESNVTLNALFKGVNLGGLLNSPCAGLVNILLSTSPSLHSSYSSSASSSGGPPPVQVACCPSTPPAQLLPQTLVATFVNRAGCGCLGGLVVPLAYLAAPLSFMIKDPFWQGLIFPIWWLYALIDRYDGRCAGKGVIAMAFFCDNAVGIPTPSKFKLRFCCNNDSSVFATQKDDGSSASCSPPFFEFDNFNLRVPPSGVSCCNGGVNIVITS
jgi:hypothetical protein